MQSTSIYTLIYHAFSTLPLHVPPSGFYLNVQTIAACDQGFRLIYIMASIKRFNAHQLSDTKPPGVTFISSRGYTKTWNTE